MPEPQSLRLLNVDRVIITKEFKLNHMKIIAQNRKAYFNYFIEEEIEAGIILMGSEVKSIRDGKVNINDAHCLEIGGQIYLVNTYISEHKGAIIFTHEPRQNRHLLLHKKQLLHLSEVR